LPKGLPKTTPLDDQQPTEVVDAVPIASLASPATKDALRVLVAYVPHERWPQVGFNVTVTEEFFRVYKNGDPISVEGVTQAGSVTPMRESQLINPSKADEPNDNHRIELRESDGRPDPKPNRGIVVVLERSTHVFRYMHLRPNDSGYSQMVQLIAKGDAFGVNHKPTTKRVLTDYKTLKQRWPGPRPIKP
jgi:hypothetical protein